MKEYAIFDLDGTLIDSFECICRNINKTLQSFDCPTCTKSQFEEYRYKDLGELFSFAVETTNGKVSMPLFKSVFNKMHFEDCIDGVTIIEKAQNLLEDAKQNGLGIIVLTNKKQEIAEKICRTFFRIDDIDYIIGRINNIPIKNSKIIVNIIGSESIHLCQCRIAYGNSDIDCQIASLLSIKYISI